MNTNFVTLLQNDMQEYCFNCSTVFMFAIKVKDRALSCLQTAMLLLLITNIKTDFLSFYSKTKEKFEGLSLLQEPTLSW